MLKSWKTTLAGLITLVLTTGNQILFALDADPATNPEWSLVITGIVAFLGLFFARDSDVSSEAAGAV